MADVEVERILATKQVVTGVEVERILATKQVVTGVEVELILATKQVVTGVEVGPFTASNASQLRVTRSQVIKYEVHCVT